MRARNRPKMHRNRSGGVLRYSGPAYVRPVSRGIVLGDVERDDYERTEYLDDLVERLIGGYGDCEVELTIRAVRVSR